MMVHWFPKIGVYETPGMRLVPSGAESGLLFVFSFIASLYR